VSATVDAGVGTDSQIIQKIDAGFSDILTATVDSGLAADTTTVQKIDTGLSDALSGNGLDVGVGGPSDVPIASADGGGAENAGGGDTGIAETGDGGQPDAGADGSVSGEAGDGDVAGANNCVKSLGVWYVVRNDGHVVLEARDKTNETPILGADNKPIANAVAATGGTYHGCALLADATVSCWRERADNGNRYGQLGDGTSDQDTTAPLHRASQVLVAAGTPLVGVEALTRGGDDQVETCAITNAGKLYCWGDLTWLVNKGTSLVSPYAQAITTDGITELSGVIQASISSTFGCVVVKGTPTNALYCWGGNGWGNLGTPDTTTRQYPTKVTTVTAPTQVAVSSTVYINSYGGTTCVIDGDQLSCWGASGLGQTGTGTTSNSVAAPTAVVTTSGTVKLPKPLDLVAAQNGTFCALEPNQTIWCWGNGYESTAGNYGLTNVSMIGGLYRINNYGAYPLFLTSDGLYHWGQEWNRAPTCQ
jgi:alpha-tubulin suppressor-like RCC1 family protein